MASYLVPAGYGEAEYIDKKSRFIGRVWPVADEREALAHIEDMRRKHADATHNVYAYLLRENNVMRFSDDGEPGGTSGMPTLNVFRSEGITDVCCVITRYFGGILLGSGGLVRAYSNTAKLALDAAGIAEMRPWVRLCVRCSYRLYERVQRMVGQQEGIVEDAQFGEAVAITLLLRAELVDAFGVSLRDLSGGTAEVETLGECFRGVPVARG